MTIIVDNERGFGGPSDCTAKCSECPIPFQAEGDDPKAAFIDRHHFNEAMTDCAEDEPDHPAAKLGHEDWYGCKHCDAWVLDLLDCEDDE